MFRKAPPANSLGILCQKIGGSDGIQSCVPMFSDPFGSGGSGAKLLLSVMVKSDAKNVMKAETSGLVLVDCVFTTLRNFLGDSGF
jgi:hypothetical protein